MILLKSDELYVENDNLMCRKMFFESISIKHQNVIISSHHHHRKYISLNKIIIYQFK